MWSPRKWREVYLSEEEDCPQSHLLPSSCQLWKARSRQKREPGQGMGQSRQCRGFEWASVLEMQVWLWLSALCKVTSTSLSMAKVWPSSFHSTSVCFIPNLLTILFPLAGIPYSLICLGYLDLFYTTRFSFHFLQGAFSESRHRVHHSFYQVHASIVLLIQSGKIYLLGYLFILFTPVFSNGLWAPWGWTCVFIYVGVCCPST